MRNVRGSEPIIFVSQFSLSGCPITHAHLRLLAQHIYQIMGYPQRISGINFKPSSSYRRFSLCFSTNTFTYCTRFSNPPNSLIKIASYSSFAELSCDFTGFKRIVANRQPKIDFKSQIIRKMHITPIPSSWGESNNYAYLIVDDSTRHGWLIDAAFPTDVLSYLAEKKPNVELKAIVNTHHHWDHAGGNRTFHKKYPDLPIIGGKDSELVTYTPSHQEVIDLGDNISITALHTPCHTQDSICYYAKDSKTGEKAVFTGDTLFISGCGRFFEGNAAEMNKALNEVLAKLPSETVVYSGHEYTKSNVRFSEKVMQNKALSELKALAESTEFTAGKSTIGDELKFNPFMRLSDPQVQKATAETDPVQVMAKLREMKNKS
ncbi:Metallo-hydrolase/oxidoreductase [Metschnikowia bicuspidata var. bicuspidata NRRL YB-4993]|uniref:hydroxyacylglutathione hydrolase n=1 Tax=Metschnikowia bicuspidata var. bicuspidata NRRL YB-4993 TaxID=869754 RepID=A0A1A0H5T9_9ASCO|nr:Metallo-hydrolase/oxidoreductase [Metschnikowia bicuspidata var. bicuspidata NRRL YB-4993]OBA19272.1 Metallo-hydrolase/oxidoreductase [Metschnikowia bicuspidata var. bicuspidata NRRL YB-4993]